MQKWLDSLRTPGYSDIPAIGLADLPKFSATPHRHDFGVVSLDFAHMMLSGNPQFEYVEESLCRNWDEVSAVGFHVAGFPREWQKLEHARRGRRVVGSIDLSLAVV